VFGCLFLGLLAAATSHAATGTSGETFLQIPLLARPAAMAGADTALATGVEGLEYNPAALSDLDNWDVAADQVSYAEGINLEELVAGWGRGVYGGGLSLISLSTPQVPETDENGTQIGTFGMEDLALTGGAARTFGPWSAGLNLRLVSLSLDNYVQHGAEADLGAGYAFGNGLKLGLDLQHLGTLDASDGSSDPTPFTVRGGVGWQGNLGPEFTLAADWDVVAPNDSSAEFLEGLEVGWRELYLRLGGEWSQDWDNRQTATFGAGFKLGDLRLDYAFSELAGIGATQRIGLDWRLGGGRRARPAATPTSTPTYSATPTPSPAAPVFTATATATPSATGPAYSATPSPAAWAFSATPSPTAEAFSATPTPSPAAPAFTATPTPSPAAPAFTATPTPSPAAPAFSPTPTPEPIAPPTGLRLTQENGQPVLVWNAAPEAGVSYQLLVSRSSGSGYFPVGGAVSGTTLAIAKVQQPLYVVVEAVRQGASGTQESPPSNEVVVEP
jgi:hypothetical protein